MRYENEHTRIDGRVYFVRRFVSAVGDAGVTWCLNADDQSPSFLGYESQCGKCWLGQSHSEAVHAARVAQ